MTAKLLTVVAESAAAPACLDAAEAAAHAIHDADVETLHVIVEPDHMIVAPEKVAFQHLRYRYKGTAKDSEAATLASYHA